MNLTDLVLLKINNRRTLLWKSQSKTKTKPFQNIYKGKNVSPLLLSDTQNPEIKLVSTTGQEVTFNLDNIPNQETLMNFGFTSIEYQGTMTVSEILEMYGWI